MKLSNQFSNNLCLIKIVNSPTVDLKNKNDYELLTFNVFDLNPIGHKTSQILSVVEGQNFSYFYLAVPSPMINEYCKLISKI